MMEISMPIYGQFNRTRIGDISYTIGYVIVEYRMDNRFIIDNLSEIDTFIQCVHIDDDIWCHTEHICDVDMKTMYPDSYMLVTSETKDSNHAAQIAFKIFQLKILELKKNNKEKVANS